MKTTRKILALLMALTLCLAIAAPALADASPTDYQIIIDNAVDGETYTAYKIFDVTYANPVSPAPSVSPEDDIPGDPDLESMHTAYSYTILDTSPWWPVVSTEYITANAESQVPASVSLGTTFTANGLRFTKTANANEWNVEATGDFDVFSFAEILDMNKAGKTAAASVTADAGDPEADPPVEGNMTNTTTHGDYYTTGSIILNVNDSGAGYYFVDTSMGALCSLDTTENIATIREKNSLPTQTKTVWDEENGNYFDSISASIGDTVYFKIDVTDGVGTDGELIVHDTMSSGLTLDPDRFTVMVNGYVYDAVLEGKDGDPDIINYTIITSNLTDGCTFEIVFEDDFIGYEVFEGDVITIMYEAVVNSNAVIAGAGNPNTSRVEYSNQMTPDSTAVVYTYAGAIYKFDGATGAELAGATFAVTADPISQEATNRNLPINGATSQPVPLTQVNPGSATTPAVYKYNPGGAANTNTIVTPASGAIVLLGFAERTVLTLTEITAPTGYNLLTNPVTITINATNVDTVDKSYTVGNVTVTFKATVYNNDHNVTTSGDDAEKQIHADSIVFIQNNTGTELPSTGGIGTTIFIIAGSILVLGAGIILVAMSVSKRRAEEE